MEQIENVSAAAGEMMLESHRKSIFSSAPRKAILLDNKQKSFVFDINQRKSMFEDGKTKGFYPKDKRKSFFVPAFDGIEEGGDEEGSNAGGSDALELQAFQTIKEKVVPLYTPEDAVVRVFMIHGSQKSALALASFALGFQQQVIYLKEILDEKSNSTKVCAARTFDHKHFDFKRVL